MTSSNLSKCRPLNTRCSYFAVLPNTSPGLLIQDSCFATICTSDETCLFPSYIICLFVVVVLFLSVCFCCCCFYRKVPAAAWRLLLPSLYPVCLWNSRHQCPFSSPWWETTTAGLIPSFTFSLSQHLDFQQDSVQNFRSWGEKILSQVTANTPRLAFRYLLARRGGGGCRKPVLEPFLEMYFLRVPVIAKAKGAEKQAQNTVNVKHSLGFHP